jgi:outer membrane receptor protein involved in Fe transport
MGKSIQSTLLGATPLSAGGAVGAAMIMALSIAPAHALAQQAAAPASSDAPPEVVVTANRRSQNIENVPYSLSVISPKQLSEAGVTDLASLAMEVPGLSLYDYGARISGAVSPIIRGINATGDPTRAFRTFEQSPVGTYRARSMARAPWAAPCAYCPMIRSWAPITPCWRSAAAMWVTPISRAIRLMA